MSELLPEGIDGAGQKPDIEPDRHDGAFGHLAVVRVQDIGHIDGRATGREVGGQRRLERRPGGPSVGGAVVGSAAVVGQEVYGFLRTCGPTMSAFNAWVFLKGLETLSIRMQAHSASAHKVALWLQQQSAVTRVFYPGLPSHPQHELAARQQSGFGGIVAFEVAGGRDAAWKLIDATQICSITANLGDTKTTITHPATTTHGRLTPEQRDEAGISDGLIRVAVGLENIDDLIADLGRGLG